MRVNSPTTGLPARLRGGRFINAGAMLAGLLLAALALPCMAQQPSEAGPITPSAAPADASTHKGGTLRLVASASGGTLDPQINYGARFVNLFANVYDGLTAFRKVAGPAGAQIVPDLAENIPTPTDGGLTYSFILRPGLRFSNGQPVSVQDVRASFQRLFKVASPTAGAFYGTIAGADACLNTPATCTLENGVEIDPAQRRITFHLTRPDTEFMHKLAFIHAVILPASSPAHDTGNTPLPGTGPYQLETYDPATRLELGRNPYFQPWNPQAQPEGFPDRITYSFGIPDETAVTAIENNQYDWMADPIPLDRLGELGSRFTSRTHVMPHPAIYFLSMNMHEPPFTELAARQAVNYALNRKALVILYGGPGIARPLCGMVPTSLPASDIGCDYTRDASPENPAPQWRGPDLERARALVRASGTAGQKVTLITANTSTDIAMGTWLRDMLESIGYKASVRPLNGNIAFPYMQNTDNHVQIGLTGWAADYPSPSNFLDALLGCENFHPHSDSSINLPGFCDKQTQDLMERARSDTALTDEARNAIWRQVNEHVMALAPMAPAFETESVILTSERVKHFIYTTINQVLFSQVWLH